MEVNPVSFKNQLRIKRSLGLTPPQIRMKKNRIEDNHEIRKIRKKK
jgi:hypothetical protein